MELYETVINHQRRAGWARNACPLPWRGANSDAQANTGDSITPSQADAWRPRDRSFASWSSATYLLKLVLALEVQTQAWTSVPRDRNLRPRDYLDVVTETARGMRHAPGRENLPVQDACGTAVGDSTSSLDDDQVARPTAGRTKPPGIALEGLCRHQPGNRHYTVQASSD